MGDFTPPAFGGVNARNVQAVHRLYQRFRRKKQRERRVLSPIYRVGGELKRKTQSTIKWNPPSLPLEALLEKQLPHENIYFRRPLEITATTDCVNRDFFKHDCACHPCVRLEPDKEGSCTQQPVYKTGG